MDKILGIIVLLGAIAGGVYIRGKVIRAMRRNSKVIYRDLKLYTSLGGNLGTMVYVISILTVVIGPFSYELISLNTYTYILMNIIAGVFFSLTYPPFAPITGFATIDVVEIKGKRYCIVGKVMNRKFKVVTINEDQKFEITVESRRQRLIFDVTK